jgi:glycerophosphoryl diester phosphodiesterase
VDLPVFATAAASALRVPRIIAHRGASTEAPEHTYAAYVAALSAEADGLECDVRLTADGHLVCVHDRRVNRVSNGTGLVSSLELARLEELDFGRGHAARDADSSGAGADADTADDEEADRDDPDGLDDRSANRVLTLRRLLDLVAAQPRRVELAIEVKHPSRYAGQVERSLVSMLDEYGWAPHGRAEKAESSPVRIMSFSSSAVRRAHRLAPGVSTVFLMEPFVYRARGGALPTGSRIAGPSIEILRTRPESVERWHQAGYEVHVWTVDEPADFELCLSLGVDAVITNRPRAMRAALCAHAPSPAG